MTGRRPGSPARVDLTLHVGMMKTGSTTVQRHLAGNRDLLAEHGVLYPSSPGTYSHVRFGLAMKSDARLDQSSTWHRRGGVDPERMRRRVRRRLAREVEEAGLDRLLLSDESLYESDEESLLRLRRYVERTSRRLSVVVYLRRQGDHLVSLYQQRVRAGLATRLVDYAARDFSGLYDYPSRLRLLERHLGPDRLVVRAFDRSRFVHGSLLEDFLDACELDVPVAALEPADDGRQSLDADCVEFLRLYNLLRQSRDGTPAARLDNRAVVRVLKTVPPGPVLTLPPAALAAFQDQWEQGNRAVARDHLPHLDGDLFQTGASTRAATWEQSLDPARLEELMVAVDLPETDRGPLRRLAAQEAGTRP